MNLTDVRYGRLIAEHPPGEEDCILAAPFDIEWRCDGRRRFMTITPGFRFWPGVQRMPWVAKIFLRLVGITKLFFTALPHDALYVCQGGRRQGQEGISITDEARDRVTISRREADLLAAEIARLEKVRPLAGKVIKFAIRRFGKEAWDD